MIDTFDRAFISASLIIILIAFWVMGSNFNNRLKNLEAKGVMEMTLDQPLKLEVGKNYIADVNKQVYDLDLFQVTLVKISANKEAVFVELLDKPIRLWIRTSNIVDEVNP